MRGASGSSLEAVVREVRGTLDGATSTRLGEELFGVVDVLDSSAALRRALTDPAREVSGRTALVQRLLGERVGAEALDVVTRLVAARWSQARDLTEATEELAVVATVSGASGGDGSAPGGGATPDTVDRVEEELFRVERLLASDRSLRAAVADRYAPEDSRTALLDRLLADKVTAGTLVLVRRAATRARGLTPERALDRYGRLAAEWRRRLVAVVTSAAPLTDGQRTRLADLLGRQYGRTVHLDTVVDPALLGGLRVEVGGELIDGTLVSRLEESRRRLTR